MNKLPTFLELYAAAAKSNLALGSAYLQGVHRIRQCQMDQISASSTEFESLASRVESLEDMGDWNALQAHVISLQMERVATYWREVQREMAVLQGELNGRIQGYAAGVGDELRHQVEHLQAEVGQSAAHLLTPLFEPQSAFAFNAYVPSQADGDARMEMGDHNGSGAASHGRKSSGKTARSSERAA